MDILLILWRQTYKKSTKKPNKQKIILDTILVALNLMIAENRTEEKDTMVKVVVNLINKNN